MRTPKALVHYTLACSEGGMASGCVDASLYVCHTSNSDLYPTQQSQPE